MGMVVQVSFVACGPLLLFAGGITSFGASQDCAYCAVHLACTPFLHPDTCSINPPPTMSYPTPLRHTVQDNIRASGNDSIAKQEKWLRRVTADRCARPEVTCRDMYSMGVRQAVWREKLYLEPDMRIVSAGIPDYLTAVPQVRVLSMGRGLDPWGWAWIFKVK